MVLRWNGEGQEACGEARFGSDGLAMTSRKGLGGSTQCRRAEVTWIWASSVWHRAVDLRRVLDNPMLFPGHGAAASSPREGRGLPARCERDPSGGARRVLRVLARQAQNHGMNENKSAKEGRDIYREK